MPTQNEPTPLGLKVLAALKIAKGVGLCGLSLGIFDLIHKDLAAMALHAVEFLRISPENRYAELLLVKVGLLEPKTIRLFGELSALEATIQLVEGFGLWFGAIWAEYVVVISSGTFVPNEYIALLHKFTWTRLTILAVNAAIFAYVAYTVWNRHLSRQAAQVALAANGAQGGPPEKDAAHGSGRLDSSP